jgi:hypothetical protein
MEFCRNKNHLSTQQAGKKLSGVDDARPSFNKSEANDAANQFGLPADLLSFLIFVPALRLSRRGAGQPCGCPARTKPASDP